MSKENYKKRLKVCSHNALQHNADSGYWAIAAEVYAHLIDCDKSHTAVDNGNGFCQWQANGVEK
jgi:hypothetical protein